jgi:SAM-dependent methyltransferase
MPPLELEDLQELLWSFAGHRVITVAARTGILTRAAQETESPQDIANALGLDPLATGKMVRALTALGLLEHAQGGYRMVPTLAPHFLPGPGNLAPFVEHSHRLYERWGETLEGWVRGEPPPDRGGAPDPRAFGAAMRAMGGHVAWRVAGALALDRMESMLDVGGGFGQYARVLCHANPDLRATVLDRSEVVNLAREELAGTELAPRIDFISGDYLTADLGQGYDLTLLANILHQEPAVSAAELVRRCAAALRPGGHVAVVDFAIDDAQEERLLGVLFAINMRSFGDTHPAPLIRRWLADAGLVSIERIELSRHRWMFLGRRPE